jgi:hypothetical protein
MLPLQQLQQRQQAKTELLLRLLQQLEVVLQPE